MHMCGLPHISRCPLRQLWVILYGCCEGWSFARDLPLTTETSRQSHLLTPPYSTPFFEARSEYPRLSLNLPGYCWQPWPPDAPATALQVLGLQVCTTSQVYVMPEIKLRVSYVLDRLLTRWHIPKSKRLQWHTFPGMTVNSFIITDQSWLWPLSAVAVQSQR